MRFLVISPHLDDAVLSCGQYLAGSPTTIVATVCTADPPGSAGDALSEYDRRSGFETSREAMRARRFEDRRACSTLDVEWRHLGFTDSQYGSPLSRDDVAGALGELVRDVGVARGRRVAGVSIVGPLGMLHPDHQHVRDAVLDTGRILQLPTFLYVELPYRVTSPLELQPALDEVVVGHGVELHEQFIGTGHRERKRLAVEQYASQRWAIETDHVMVPEMVFEVTSWG